MDLNRPPHEVADPKERDDIAAAKIADMLEHVEAAPLEWPADTGEIVNAMQALGYRIDGDYLFGLLDEGIPPVRMLGGRRRWTPFDGWHLMAVLESRRRWTLHPLHVHKMTAVEVQALENEQAGRPAFHDLDTFGVEQLVLLMEGAEQSAMRHVIRVALVSKLREAGAL